MSSGLLPLAAALLIGLGAPPCLGEDVASSRRRAVVTVPPAGDRAPPSALPDPARDGADARPVDASDLGDASRVTLTFRGYPDLSRDYRVAADGALSVPVIGRIRIAGMTPEALETLLAARMTAVIGAAAYVTVEVADYQPVFVTGYVVKSDATSWRPGMTVLQAVAASGGLFRSAETAGGSASTPADVERARVKRAATDLKLALATSARLRAEQDATAAPIVPETLVALVGAAEAQDLMRAQNALLTSRREAYAGQLAAIERGMTLGRQELDGLRIQKSRIEALLVTRRNYSEKVAGLQARGVVVVSRSLDEEVRVSDLEEKSVNVSVAIARILGAIAGAERDAIRLRFGDPRERGDGGHQDRAGDRHADHRARRGQDRIRQADRGSGARDQSRQGRDDRLRHRAPWRGRGSDDRRGADEPPAAGRRPGGLDARRRLNRRRPAGCARARAGNAAPSRRPAPEGSARPRGGDDGWRAWC